MTTNDKTQDSHQADPSGSVSPPAFTPGPWITETTAAFVWIGPPKARGTKVADVVTGIPAEGLTEKAEAKVFANARLIAAAPDLLEALQDAIAAGTVNQPPWVAKARAAISKATSNTGAGNGE